MYRIKKYIYIYITVRCLRIEELEQFAINGQTKYVSICLVRLGCQRPVLSLISILPDVQLCSLLSQEPQPECLLSNVWDAMSL